MGATKLRALGGLVAILLCLLVVLSALQYRWIGEVSNAELQRLRQNLNEATAALAEDFSREAFLAVAAEQARNSRVFDLRIVPRAGAVERFGSRDLSSADLRLIQRAEIIHPNENDVAGAFGIRSDSPKALQLIVPIPGRPPSRLDRPVGPDWLVLEFDSSYLASEFFPKLVKRHFLSGALQDYDLAVRSTSPDRLFIYKSDAALTDADFQTVDAAARLFLPGPRAAGSRWELVVKHHLGTLDTVAGRLRFRNLAISFGILVILVASVATIIAVAARARNLAKCQMEFAAGVSHELRSPLAVIHASAYNLANGLIQDPERVAQYAEVVLDEVRGLASTVDQVLLFAETRSQKKYEVGTIDVVDLLDRTLSGLTAQIQEHHCKIMVAFPDDMPLVQGSATPMMHCVRNLISNAMKYGKQAHEVPSVEVVGTVNWECSEVQLSVIDRGPGIDPHDRPHIFEPFFRGRGVQPGTRGAGLGLYLVKRLIEAQGGSVSVCSNSHEGCRFTLHIPIATQASHELEQAASC